jgi:hypothetical protein
MIISNNREVIKIPLGKGIVNCREICGPMTRLCSINKNIKKTMTLKEASRIFYLIHSEVQRQDDRHCGVLRQDDIYCGVQRFRDKMKDIVKCRDAEIG